MRDVNKIISGLQCIYKGVVCCDGCEYANDDFSWNGCQAECAKEAILLIRKQIGALIDKNQTIIEKNEEIIKKNNLIIDRNNLILTLMAEKNGETSNV